VKSVVLAGISRGKGGPIRNLGEERGKKKRKAVLSHPKAPARTNKRSRQQTADIRLRGGEKGGVEYSFACSKRGD